LSTNIFQFPLLGIFSCINCFPNGLPCPSEKLSIPVTWDFLLHQLKKGRELFASNALSIPVTWDFLLHLEAIIYKKLINISGFQFPLLGIFSCIIVAISTASSVPMQSFNSRYLGFSLASKRALHRQNQR